MEDLKNLLTKGSESLNIYLSEEQIEKFLIYLKKLKEWNQKFNLTAIFKDKEIIEKHFLDSISCSFAIDFKKQDKIIDIGTGAGFPGIPLKIYQPEIELTLIDSVEKKIIFLKHLSSFFKFDKIKIIHCRAEDFPFKNSYEIVLCRAVKPIEQIVALCLSFLKKRGIFISQKGKLFKEEEEKIKKIIRKLGAEIKEIKKFYLPFSKSERHLLVIEKIK